MAETASELRDRVPIPHKAKSWQDDKLVVHRQESTANRNELGFRQLMLAGSIAGIIEHVAMFPVDTLKTRVQMICESTVSKAFCSLARQEGAPGFYRGVGAMVLAAGPSHAVHFAVYEECKRRFETSPSEGYHPIAHMSAGACATIASDAVSTPMDVVKQRLQLKNSPYKGIGDCVQKIIKHEGVQGFYASYRTTVLMNLPFYGAYFAAYEAGKKSLSELVPDHASEEYLVTQLVAGGAAGAIASAVTTPLDVVKTRLQCQGVCGAQRFQTGSTMEVLRKIAAREGLRALFRGLVPRVLFHTPAAAISWSVYEAGKSFLHRWNEESSR